jgi:NAD(P)-dependent dehydrogenase (short-subunit alcohol dehydrogenase family)
MTPDNDMPHPGGARPGRSAPVVGATGLVGRELVRRLATEPGLARVVALVRRPIEEPARGNNRAAGAAHPGRS